jgi:EAL domain
MAVQPIVSVSEGRVHAYEALARFRLGSNSDPVHWFALADEFALRDRLELACLREGLKLLGDLPAGARLSVNLSGPLLLDPRTSELLRGTPHLDRLILEVTENSLLEDTPGVAAEIARLIGEGLNFAVDDMGAGYSGLRQITTVPSHLPQARPLADQRHRRGSRPWRAGHGDARLRPPDRWSSDRRGRGDRRRAGHAPAARRHPHPGLHAGPSRRSVPLGRSPRARASD